MAIKGKSKKRSKSGKGRVATGAPKPKLVVPPTPLAQRTWFRVLAVIVLLGLIGGAVAAAIISQRNAAEREAAQEEVSRVGVRIENAVNAVGQSIPGGGVLVLPQLGPLLAEIQNEDARPRRVERQVEGWQEDIDEALGILEDIRTDRQGLVRAIDRIVTGLELVPPVLEDLLGTLDLEGEERTEAIQEIQSRYQEASGTIEGGLLIYRNERVDVGLDEGTPGFDAQVPPGFAPPGPGDVEIPTG